MGVDTVSTRVLIRGVEEPLPDGENLLWEGRPELAAAALRVFYLKPVLLYLAVVAAGFVAWSLVSARPTMDLMADLAWIAVVAGVAALMSFSMALLLRATTTYAVTDRRVVMRIGMALSGVFNLPLDRIASVDYRAHADGTGDLVITPVADEPMSWLLLWPHVRPWKVRKPLPTLRAIREPEGVGHILANALKEGVST